MAGLLARESTSGRLPGYSTSGVLPLVIAYSGGTAGELHPTSLLSPCGRPDPYRKAPPDGGYVFSGYPNRRALSS